MNFTTKKMVYAYISRFNSTKVWSIIYWKTRRLLIFSDIEYIAGKLWVIFLLKRNTRQICQRICGQKRIRDEERKGNKARSCRIRAFSAFQRPSNKFTVHFWTLEIRNREHSFFGACRLSLFSWTDETFHKRGIPYLRFPKRVRRGRLDIWRGACCHPYRCRRCSVDSSTCRGHGCRKRSWGLEKGTRRGVPPRGTWSTATHPP